MYHTIIIVGHLGRDPEMRYTPSGQAVTNFSVATNRVYTSSDGNKVEETTWFRVSAWRRTAETTNQYLKKGSRVLVEGWLNPDPQTGGPRVYTRQDGTSGAQYEVTANVVRFLSARGEVEEGYEMEEPGGQVSEDDIPF